MPRRQHAASADSVERNPHVRERFRSGDERLWRMSLADSLLHYLLVGDEADVIASMDSALHQGLVSVRTLDEIFAVAPRRLRRLRRRIDAAAESGLEMLMRLACEAEGWRVDVQVYIDGVGRVDLLIDGWLVIELDGSTWHDSRTDRDEDSRRDAELILLGYRYHRFRYRQVMNQLAMCVEVVRAMRPRAGHRVREQRRPYAQPGRKRSVAAS